VALLLVTFEGAKLELRTMCCGNIYLSNTGCNRWKTGEAYLLQFATGRAVWSWLWCSVDRFV